MIRFKPSLKVAVLMVVEVQPFEESARFVVTADAGDMIRPEFEVLSSELMTGLSYSKAMVGGQTVTPVLLLTAYGP